MSEPPVKVAVVGHTNTGKTSLMRTLLRDVEFGEVSDHPAVTRHVEGSAILVQGMPVIELYDTPGLEDSIALLEQLERLGRDDRQRGRRDWVEVIAEFLDSPLARERFAQESKALRQVLRSDVALYVIDARDRVLGKHRDELEILSRCARPVVPVLNFTAPAQAQTAVWREHLSRVNMHAVAEFDTVVYEEDGERRLFEKMQTLLDGRRDVFERLVADRRDHRRRQIAAAARLVADLLIDVAAHVATVAAGGHDAAGEAIESMKERVREREQRCLRQLLELFRFRPDDGRLAELPIEDGRWGLDVFSPAALRQFGVRAGSAAAAGAVAGLALDAMTLGASFGLFAATGAAIGAFLQTGRSYGRRLLGRARGFHELRCDDGTLRLLLSRQLALARALLHRGHAAVAPLVVGVDRAARRADRQRELPQELLRARANPGWSSMLDRHDANKSMSRWAAGSMAPARVAAERSLAAWIEGELIRAV